MITHSNKCKEFFCFTILSVSLFGISPFLTTGAINQFHAFPWASQVFATSHNGNDANAENLPNTGAEEKSEADDSDNGTGLEHSDNIKEESVKDKNEDTNNFDNGFENTNTFENKGIRQTGTGIPQLEDYQEGQTNSLQDDFDSSNPNNYFSEIKNDLGSFPMDENSLLEKDTPLLEHGRLSISLVGWYLGSYFKEEGFNQIIDSVYACVQTLTPDGRTVPADPNCIRGIRNSTHELVLEPGRVQIDIQYDPLLTIISDNCSTIDYIEALELRSCGVQFTPPKPHAFDELNKQ